MMILKDISTALALIVMGMMICFVATPVLGSIYAAFFSVMAMYSMVDEMIENFYL